MRTTNQSDIHSVLLQECNSLLIDKVNKGNVALPEPWYALDLESLPLCYYPDDILDLADELKIEKDALKRSGWYKPANEGKIFIAWRKSDGTAQISVINSVEWQVEQNNRLNKSVPAFFYSAYSVKGSSEPIFVFQKAVDAALMISKGYTAVGLEADYPMKKQITALSKLCCPLIFICKNCPSDQQAMEKFVLSMARYADVSVIVIDDGNIRDWVLSESIAPLRGKQSGIKQLANRIMLKENGKDIDARSLDIMAAAAKLGPNCRDQFINLAKELGAKPNAHVSESLRLYADLIDAGMSSEEAKIITTDKYGITIFMREIGNSTLI